MEVRQKTEDGFRSHSGGSILSYSSRPGWVNIGRVYVTVKVRKARGWGSQRFYLSILKMIFLSAKLGNSEKE